MDQVVHFLGVAWVLVAVPLLLFSVAPWDDPAKLAGCLLYSVGMIWTVCISAAYNIVEAPGPKSILRRLDHSGIFVMIAGTYSPFALAVLGGGLGLGVFLYIWALAAVGVFLSMRLPHKADMAGLVLCLAMGWSVVFIIQPLIEAVSTAVLVLLMVGGGLYTSGVAFHLSRGLRYHNAIWHLFVLAAVICHWIAVLLAMHQV